MGSGYANRVIKIDFPELSSDWDADPVWLIIKNPRLLPAREITAITDMAGAYDADGKIADRALAEAATDKMIARLVIAARVYDATAVPEYDPLTGEVVSGAEQPLLPPAPWEPETAARLPLVIRMRVGEEFTTAQNPPRAREGSGMQKTSSSPPSPSTTAPGAETPSPPN
jgi:hypothetical protein